jgi:amidase
MARSVADATLVLNAIAGGDPRDPATAQADRRRPQDYSKFLDDGGLKGARIGVACQLAGFHEGVDRIFEASLVAMREAGAEVIEDVTVVGREEVRAAELQVFLTEFKAGLRSYLATRGPDTLVRSLADVIAFNRDCRDRTMPYFPQDLFERAEETKGLDDPAYRKARAACLRLTRTEGLDKALAEHRLDAIVAPTTCAPWLIDWVNGDNRSGGSAYLAAVSGYPAITLPAGYLFGLPVGLTFMASAYQEPTLIRLTSSFEAATRIRRPPGFARHADL